MSERFVAAEAGFMKHTASALASTSAMTRIKSPLMLEAHHLTQPWSNSFALDQSAAEGAMRSAERRPDDVPVPTFCPRMVCTRCGIIGADARPNWKERPARESLTGVQGR